MSLTNVVSLLVGLLWCHMTIASGTDGQSTSGPAANLWPPQVQVAVWVPFEPTAFQSAGQQYVVYELYLTNFEDHTLRLNSIEVIDAIRATAKPAASFEGPQLNRMIHRVGQPIIGDEIGSAEDNSQRDIAAGQSSIVYLLVKSAEHAQIPDRLVHRLVIGDSTVEAAAISTHHDQVLIVGPPLNGGPWIAGSGPGNESHHRRQILMLEGSLHISSRFAIDWIRLKNSEASSGDKQDNRSYFSYDQPVLAVSDAKVVSKRDGIAENIPGHFGKGKLAVAMSYDTMFGNMIVLDLGGGQYAYYGHLKPGSILVKEGDRVKRGQIIARIGDTGSSFEPHLHFEITTSNSALRGEGVPYALDGYTETTKDGAIEKRMHELPLDGTLVTFSN
jgi:murein DD-endopeptidase MepM/ murein hydrolase activator NlpD